MASRDLQIELLRPKASDILQEMVGVVRSVARSYFANASVVMQWKVGNKRKRRAVLDNFCEGLCKDFPFLSKPSEASMEAWASDSSSKSVGAQIADRFVHELATTDPDNLSPGALRVQLLDRVIFRLRTLALRRLQDTQRVPVALACLETFFGSSPDEDAWNEFARQWTEDWCLDGADLLGCHEAWSVRPSVLEDLYHLPRPGSVGSVCASFVRDASAAPEIDLVSAAATGAATGTAVGPCVTADGALCWGSRSRELASGGGGMIAWVDASTGTFVRSRPTAFGQTMTVELWTHGTMLTSWTLQVDSASFNFLDTADAGSGRVLVVYGTRSSYTGECDDSEFFVLRKAENSAYELDDEAADAMTPERMSTILESRWSRGFAVQAQQESETSPSASDDGAPLLRYSVAWKLVDHEGNCVGRGRTPCEDRPVAVSSTSLPDDRAVAVVWLDTDRSRPGVVVDIERGVACGTVASPGCVVRHALLLNA